MRIVIICINFDIFCYPSIFLEFFIYFTYWKILPEKKIRQKYGEHLRKGQDQTNKQSRLCRILCRVEQIQNLRFRKAMCTL